MRIFLAYFFLFIISFQVLPVKELGKMFAKGTLTEEIHEGGSDIGDNDISGKMKKTDHEYRCVTSESFLSTAYFTDIVYLTILQSEHFLRQFIPDITTPPPNNI